MGSTPAFSRLLSTVLVRHIKDIHNPPPLQDLPYICGRTGLVPECILAIRSLLERDWELPATCWCNMGAVLSDNARQQEPALACFFRSIEVDSTLLPPRQGVWQAGRRLMHECLAADDYARAVEIAERVDEVGEPTLASHGFFTYWGLALEMLGGVVLRVRARDGGDLEIVVASATKLEIVCFVVEKGEWEEAGG